jgi:hypothetical protein
MDTGTPAAGTRVFKGMEGGKTNLALKRINAREFCCPNAKHLGLKRFKELPNLQANREQSDVKIPEFVGCTTDSPVLRLAQIKYQLDSCLPYWSQMIARPCAAALDSYLIGVEVNS